MREWQDLPSLRGLLEMSCSRASVRRGMSDPFRRLLEQELSGGPPFHVVKVTGTNGKGSVCAMLEACLVRDGRRVGLFTSPHLSSPTERFRLNGEDVAEVVLEAHAERLGRTVAAGIAEHGDAWRPSFFEMLVVLSLRLFRERGVEIAIYEAGVGGYDDATSLIPGDFSAITGIALDHQDRLGDTVEEIAADKAGIASPGSDLVVAALVPPAARRVIEADATARGVTVWPAPLDDLRVRPRGTSPQAVELDVPGGTLRFELPLLGPHQIENLATATAVARLLHRSGLVRDIESICGVAATRWPGRLELRPGSPSVLLDVAHNEQGILALAAALDALVPRERRVLLYGASEDKNYAACLPHLPRIAPVIHVVEGFHRAARALSVSERIPGGAVAAQHPNVETALRALAPEPKGPSRRAGVGAVLVVTGSVFLVGTARDALAGRAAEVDG